MGVTGLWTVLEPAGRPVKLETLSRKRLAVDASIWIYQFLKAVRDKEGNQLHNSHIIGFFRRIAKLLFHGIRPVFVFDGGAPPLKRQTISRRKQHRAGKRIDAASTAAKLLATQHHRQQLRESHGDNATEETQKKIFRKKDEYHLPEMDIPLEQLANSDDPRIITGADMKLIRANYGSSAEMGIYDFSQLDFDSAAFKSLPLTDQYNIINAARLRSRLRMGLDKGQLEAMFPNRLEFSKFQIQRVKERNELTQRLMNINGMNEIDSMRLAGNQNREYILIKNNNAEGGYALGLVTKDGGAGKNNASIDDIAQNSVTLSLSEMESKKRTRNEDTVAPFFGSSNTATGYESHVIGNESSPLGPSDDDDDDDSGFVDVPIARPTESREIHSALPFFNDNYRHMQKNSSQSILACKGAGESLFSKKAEDAPAKGTAVHLHAEDASLSGLQIPKNEGLFDPGLEAMDSNDEEDVVDFQSLEENLHEPLMDERADATTKSIDFEPLEKKVKFESSIQDSFATSQNGSLAQEADNSDSKIASRSTVSSSMESKKTIIKDETSNVLSNDKTLPIGVGAEEVDHGKTSVTAAAPHIDSDELRYSKEESSIASGKELHMAIISEAATVLDNGSLYRPLDDRVEISEPTPTSETEALQENENNDAKPADEIVQYEMTEEDEAELKSDYRKEEKAFEQLMTDISNEQKYRELQEQYAVNMKQLHEQQKRERRDADEVTQTMIRECQELLRLFGLPYITAPMEAEAQCATLLELGLVDGIVTDDSDIFLFGGDRIYKNMFNNSKYVELYLMADLHKEFGLMRENLIRIAKLLGSDYTTGLSKVGPVTALQILVEFSGTSGLQEFKAWCRRVQTDSELSTDNTPFRRRFRKSAKNIEFPERFLDTEVDKAYLYPDVDSSNEEFQWGVPDLDGIRKFLMSTIGWSYQRTNEVLVPVIRDMNKKITEGLQSNITSFIGVQDVFAPRRRYEFKSQRLGRAMHQLRYSSNHTSSNRDLTGPNNDQTGFSDGHTDIMK